MKINQYNRVITTLPERTLNSSSYSVTNDSFISILSNSNCGIPMNHVIKLTQIAKRKNIIFGIRPIHKMLSTLLEENYPAKGIEIKAKSSNFGPMLGFIPIKQELSKLQKHIHQPKGKEKIKKFNQQIQETIQFGYATKTTLTLTQKRINELADNGYITKRGSYSNKLTLQSRTLTNDILTFEAHENSKGDFTLYEKKPDQSLAPLEVLSNNHTTPKPLIADYDLLLIAPHISDYGVKDLTRTDFSNNKLTLEHLTKKNNIKQKRKGFYTQRSERLSDIINNSLRGTEHSIIQHGEDTLNPQTAPDDNYPAMFFLPRSMGDFGSTNGNNEGAFAIIEKKDMIQFIQTIKDANFHFNIPAAWGEELTNIKRTSFQNAKKVFEKS